MRMAEIRHAHRGDGGRLLRRREGLPGETAQAAPEIGARQGFRWWKRAPVAHGNRDRAHRSTAWAALTPNNFGTIR